MCWRRQLLNRAPSFAAASTIRFETAPISSSVKLFSDGWSVTSIARLSEAGHREGLRDVGWRGDAETREELELVSTEVLDGATLAEIRRLALELEQHAYEISPDLYGQTDPAG